MFTNIKAVRVQEVIMQSVDPAQSGSANVIGNIRYNNLNEGKPSPNIEHPYTHLPFARPLFNNISQYPVVNEVVYILIGPKDDHNITGGLGGYYFPPLNINGSPQHNAQPNELTPEELEAATETGLDYFKEVENVRPLQPYLGDIMLEGRYGQSIRFGSTINLKAKEKPVPNNWSNEGEVGNPITIIRNGQTGNEQGGSFEHILEDINGDDSSIYLCSNQQISNFTKAGIKRDGHPASYLHMLSNE